MFNKTLKRNKGITLIALVVTIIVLLILAGISIMMLTGQNGILNRANQAKENTGTAQTEELVKLSVTDALTQGLGSLTDENLKSALNNNIGTGKYTITGDEENGWTITVNGKEYKVDETGNVTRGTTGDDNGGTQEPSGGWIADDTNTEFSKDNIKLKIGDYVNYNCVDGLDTKTEVEERTIYTSTADKNGFKYNDKQIFKITDYTGKWQVLGVDKNGCLQLISSDIIVPNNEPIYSLEGKDGYANGVSELDKISSLYGQGKYAKSARSVKIEDINKITGYKDDNYNSEENPTAQTGNSVTYTLNTDSIYYKGTKYPTQEKTSDRSKFMYWTEAEWKTLEKGKSITIPNKFYSYYPQTLTQNEGSGSTIKNLTGEAGTNAYNLLFSKDNQKKCYWIGSQYTATLEGLVEFGLRTVWNDLVGGFYLFYSDDSPFSDSYGVRPVVTLKAEIQITSGRGVKDAPWTLGE